MGRNISQNVSMEFIIEDEERAKEIVSEILEENGVNDSEIENGHIWNTGLGEDFHISLISEPDGWEDVSVSFGNFSIFKTKYRCYIDSKEFENFSNELKIIGDKIAEKYNIKYEIIVLATYG